MDKDAYYFSHDSNAQNDPKIIKLLYSHGWEGYGIYWAIIEKLRSEPNYIMETNYDMLSYALRCETDIVKSIIEGFDLFEIDDVYFYSISLKNRMEKMNNIRDIRAKSGRKGGKSQAKAKQKPSKTQALKESKRKESKVNKSKIYNKSLESIDKIYLDELQNSNLDVNVEKQFEQFRDYLDANGKTYKDYRAGFRTWLKSPYCEKTTEIRDKRNKKAEMKTRVIKRQRLEEESASPEEIRAEVDKAIGKISRKYTV